MWLRLPVAAAPLDEPLRAALGSPLGHLPVPGARTAGWRTACLSLNRALAPHCSHTVRSPRSLWASLHASDWLLPTWDALCSSLRLRDLVDALNRHSQLPSLCLGSWNVRYLRSTTAHKNQIKHAILTQMTSKGRVGLLQETHWSEHEAAVWSTMFPARTLVASPAFVGPGGGLSGGVAILLPHGVTLVRSEELVPGCGIAATVRIGSDLLRVVSVYLPPSRKEATLASLREAAEAWDALPTYWGGDANVQVALPRDGESELAADFSALLHAHGSALVHVPGPTRVDANGESQIDFLACPLDRLGSASPRKAWKLSVSDHALLYLDTSGTARSRRDNAIRPGDLRALPSEAFADLRASYTYLERMFNIPDTDLTGLAQPTDWVRPAAPGHLPDLHPANDTGDGVPPPDAVPPVPPDTDHQTAPLVPSLMLLGRHATSAMIQAWWNRWRRSRHVSSPGSLLALAAGGQSPCRPVGALATWLTACGWDGSDLSPVQAAGWLLRWDQGAQQRRAGRLTPAQRGAGAERPTLAAHYRTGREIFVKTHAILGVRDGNGAWHESPGAVDRILWDSRKDIWQTAPPVPENALAILDWYFRGMDVGRHSDRPDPAWNRLAALVLSPGGSAPGLDGEPYEVYQPGARFIACLIAQAWYAADLAPEMVTTVLGPSIDLLVWIGKKIAAEVPNEMRPLQLPTCMHRLFGASLADRLGPVVEPRLSPDQAAKKGGQCGPNITRATSHLGAPPAPPRPPGEVWRLLLGRHYPVLERYVRRVAERLGPAPSTAALFCDQNKAFERVSLQWMAMLLSGWRLPPWLRRALGALMQGRHVRVCRGKFKSPLRRLLRSVGMGGTASPLLWGMGYDPLIRAVADIAGEAAPTYVDDLASLLSSTEQALRVAFALPWLARLAGLLVETHSCRGIMCPDRTDIRDALADAPVTVTRHPDGLRISGLPGDLLVDLVRHTAGDAAAAVCSPWATRCSCRFKTALVPASHHAWWRELMAATPFGESAVVDRWPYLGAVIVSRAGEGESPPPAARLTAGQVDDLVRGTWGRILPRLRDRAMALHLASMSPSRTAAAWNAYLVSLVPYPAHYMAPDAYHERQLRAHLRVALGLASDSWVPDFVLSGLGVVFQVPGCPRCPAALARAIAARAHAVDDVWGPAPARKRARTRWGKLVRWAPQLRLGAPLDDIPPRPGSRVLSASRAAELVRSATTHPARVHGRYFGRVIYVAAWAQMHLDTLRHWLRTTSEGRRWGRTNGAEWSLLTHCASFTEAHHLLRLLANGLPGSARRRGAADRVPHQCSCGRPATRVWLTAGGNDPGAAWCDTCLGPWAGQASLWPLLDDADLPAYLAPLAAPRRRVCGRIQVPRRCGQFGVCPLCGLGEATTEHIWSWCPAVALAWTRAREEGHPADFATALCSRGDHQRLACRLAHQISYRFCVNRDCTPLGAEVAATLVLQGIVVPDSDQQADSDLEDDWHEGQPLPPDPGELAVWAPLAEPCATCCPQGPPATRIHGSARPHASRQALRAGGELRRLPVIAHATAPDERLAVLQADQPRAGWLPPGPGWFPCPRVDARPSATWECSYCHRCDLHTLVLRACRALDPGDEITVRDSPFPDASAAQWPYEVTFDGGARSIRDADKVAGAGALLWRHDPHLGAPRVVAAVVVALPGDDNAQTAEAAGCRAGLALLPHVVGPVRGARVVGDNLAAIRYGAGTGRYRRLHLAQQMDFALRQAADAGWVLSWQAVRRRLNKGADAVATLGVYWAHALRNAGHRSVTTYVFWDSAPSSPPPHFPCPQLNLCQCDLVLSAVAALERPGP